MQQVNFFDSRWYTETTNAPLFFIYDKGAADVAHLSIDTAEQCTSVNVINPSLHTILFLPVDHNLNIKKEGSNDLDSTCDYLLTVNYREQIIFGEIKTGRKGWISEGAMQVKHTFDIFCANHDITQWNQCRAYVSNYHHWYSKQSSRFVREDFKAKTGGVRLYIQNEVHIDGEEL